MQYIPLKHWHASTRPHVVTTQNIVIDIFIAMGTSGLRCDLHSEDTPFIPFFGSQLLYHRLFSVFFGLFK
jgi:hypothetical protein